jgi:hypothetical protein
MMKRKTNPDHEIVVKVYIDPETQQHILRELSNSKDVADRMRAAAFSGTGRLILSQLRKDIDPDVRKEAIQNIKRKRRTDYHLSEYED